MKKNVLLAIFLLLLVLSMHAQTAKDLFHSEDVKITWLGIDYTNVKLKGVFSQFMGIGEKEPKQVRDDYFPSWNKLILRESKKYDIEGMIHRDKINYEIDHFMEINAETSVSDLEVYDTPDPFTTEDIQKFADEYEHDEKEGIGVYFVAELLDKPENEGWFHFVAINMGNNKVLFHRRLMGEPRGFGIRNYWAGSLYHISKDIRKRKYKKWKKEH